MALLLVLLAILNGRMRAIIVRSQEDEALHHLQVQAMVAAGSLRDPLNVYGDELEDHEEDEKHEHRLARWTSELGREGGFELTVLDRLGRAVDGRPLGEHREGMVREALEGRPASAIHGDDAVASAPVVRDGRVAGAVVLSRRLDESRGRAGRLSLELGLTSVAIVLAAGAATLWISRRLLAPLEALRRGADAVAAGDLAARVAVGDDVETGAVAAAFNAMLDALERSARQQRLFVASASHELRTPLTNIKLRSEALAAGRVTDPARRTRYLEDIDREADRLTRLASALLDLSRLESVEPPAPREIDPEQALRAVAESFAAALEARRQTLEIEVDPATRSILCDPDDLERALSNLVENAVKYAPEEGVITLSASPCGAVGGADAGVRLRVRDSGPGIAADDLEHVFDPFFRADRARGRGGAGLGLATVRARIERNGGRVRAESLPGAVFTVELPAA
jgi:two-component system sensor histidine kinase MprB